MIITITAPAGGNKTKTALEMSAFLGLMNNKKVVYITKDNDYNGWIPYLEGIVGPEKMTCFRPMYANDLSGAIHILPYIDHLPYDIIVFDGFGDEFASLSSEKVNELISESESYTTNNSGKIIITLSSNFIL